MKRLEKRDYQEEALKWALKRKKAVICMPTGTGKTVIAGRWLKEVFKKGVSKALVIEPTRILVEQTAKAFREMGLDAKPLHGSLGRHARREGIEAKIVVATPEIVLSEGLVNGMDALVVDECHHTTGQDPYVKVAGEVKSEWRLGLTPYIPPSRKGLIEDSIGDIRCWSWDDERIRRYMPRLVAEVYESPLNEAEERLYHELEERWLSLRGREKALMGMVVRWYVKEGFKAVLESYQRSKRIRSVLGDIDLEGYDGVRPLHKLPSLDRILRDHEGFEKAIVFIDRVSIARHVADHLSRYGAVSLVGRRHGSIEKTLRRIRMRDTHVIISTSAGEEGVDLPEADLLVIWSQTASPLRFIQRLGRLLRPSEDKVKYAVFIATPDTVDMDSLVDGLAHAERIGIYTGVDRDVLHRLILLSRRRMILNLLSDQPLPEDILAEALSVKPRLLNVHLRTLISMGYIIYFYSRFGRIYVLRDAFEKVYEHFPNDFQPNPHLTAYVSAENLSRGFRGNYGAVLGRMRRALERHGVLKNIYGYVVIQHRAIETHVKFRYGYDVDRIELLDAIVDNIFSGHIWGVRRSV